MDRIKLTKVQMALLRAADEASVMTGTRGIVSEPLLRRITGHFFRPALVYPALRELIRARYLVLLPEDLYRVVLRPHDWRDCFLPGYEPEALSLGGLTVMIRETGANIVEEPTPMPSAPPVPAPRDPSKNTPQWTRRFRLLANHRLAETWYGDALPPELSSAVVCANQNDARFFIALRYKLASERLMETLRRDVRSKTRNWRVSPLGIESYEHYGIDASLSPLEVETIGASLGLVPLPRGNQPGC